MASFELFAPKLLRLEGLYNNDPADRGGPTNMGITLATWKQVGYDKDQDGIIDKQDLRQLSREDVLHILRIHYWDRWHADEIKNQALAEMLVDWLWSSGRWGITIPQRLLGLREDGIVGPRTLKKINEVNPNRFLLQIYNARVSFILNIIRSDPTQKRFERGWFNRLNDFL
jgi:lysozyme family protein